MKSKKAKTVRNKRKQKTTQSKILNKIKKCKYFTSYYYLYAFNYYYKCGDDEIVNKITEDMFDEVEGMDKIDEFSKYIPQFWFEDSHQKIIEKCPHVTFDKTEIIFPSKTEINKELKKRKRFYNGILDIDDRYVIDSKTGNEFLRWKLCYKKQKVPWRMNENDDDDIIPWCNNYKQPACCCNCNLCYSLPVNIRCHFLEFIDQFKMLNYFRQGAHNYYRRTGRGKYRVGLEKVDSSLPKLMAFELTIQ